MWCFISTVVYCLSADAQIALPQLPIPTTAVNGLIQSAGNTVNNLSQQLPILVYGSFFNVFLIFTVNTKYSYNKVITNNILSFMKLLIIEDDKDMARALKTSLKNDYVLELAYTGEEGLFQLSVNEYDLIILDYMLPDINGLEIITELRRRKLETPKLVLTGIDAVDVKVLMLDSGGDDYLVKPVHMKELKARIRLLLRRHRNELSSRTFSIGDLSIDVASKTVSREKKNITLRRKEFDLLEYFIRNHGKVLTRSMILDHIWDSSYDSFTNVVDVHVNYLRRKVDKPFQKQLIKTVHGIGYKLEW